MNSLYLPLSQDILMLFALVGTKMILLNSSGQETDSLVSSAGYVQMFDKPTYGVINSMWYTDLIFCKSKNIISNHRDDVTIFWEMSS